MMGGTYLQSVRRMFIPEFISMNFMMGAMAPVMSFLMMGRDMRAMVPTELLRDAGGTHRSDAHTGHGRHGDGQGKHAARTSAHDMSSDATQPQIVTLALVSITRTIMSIDSRRLACTAR